MCVGTHRKKKYANTNLDGKTLHEVVYRNMTMSKMSKKPTLFQKLYSE